MVALGRKLSGRVPTVEPVSVSALEDLWLPEVLDQTSSDAPKSLIFSRNSGLRVLKVYMIESWLLFEET